MPKRIKKLRLGFTLAEILLSLTIIGIVAAIALPSLLGNANERAWETQKKALYTRFSQALPLLPSLNGYGELVGNLSDCADANSCYSDGELKDTAAESFIRDGLSKVIKITNICDSEHLSDCGLPNKIIPIDGGNAITLANISSLADFNDKFKGKIEASNGANSATYEQLDTKAAAFETVNGESVLVYYNPRCQTDMKEYNFIFMQSKMCANFVYDLNGVKGPNAVGKDIGFISALYSSDPSVVAPKPYPKAISNSVTQTNSFSKCREMDPETKLPNAEEMASIFYNRKLMGELLQDASYWTSTAGKSGYYWIQSMVSGRRLMDVVSKSYQIHCIKK